MFWNCFHFRKSGGIASKYEKRAVISTDFQSMMAKLISWIPGFRTNSFELDLARGVFEARGYEPVQHENLDVKIGAGPLADVRIHSNYGVSVEVSRPSVVRRWKIAYPAWRCRGAVVVRRVGEGEKLLVICGKEVRPEVPSEWRLKEI